MRNRKHNRASSLLSLDCICPESSEHCVPLQERDRRAISIQLHYCRQILAEDALAMVSARRLVPGTGCQTVGAATEHASGPYQAEHFL